jgi:hypothetical protein
MGVIPNTNPSALNYADNLLVNQLNTQMNPGVVFQLSNKTSVFNYFLRLVDAKFGGSTSLYTDEIVSASRGLDYIQARVNSRSVGNSPIVLTFDSQVDAARVGDKIYYGNAFERVGRVMEVKNGPGGFVKIQPAFAGSFTSADFPVGSLVGIHGDISAKLSDQKARRFLNPTLQYNNWSIQREGYHVARYEKTSTRVTVNGVQPTVYEKDGQWWTSFQEDMMARLESSLDWDFRFSESQRFTIDGEEYTTNGGVRWHVKNRGGDYLGFRTPLVRDQIDMILSKAMNKNIGVGCNYVLFCGQGLWKILNDFNNNYIVNAGILNTWAGEDVKGLNIPLWYVNGISTPIAIVIDPRLNEALDGGLGTYSTIPGYTQFTLGQLTGFLMCDASVRTPNGGTTPQFKLYHFGDQPYNMGILKGIDGNSFNGRGAVGSANVLDNDALMVSTLQDASQFGLVTQYGMDGTGYGCAWIEPLA